MSAHTLIGMLLAPACALQHPMLQRPCPSAPRRHPHRAPLGLLAAAAVPFTVPAIASAAPAASLVLANEVSPYFANPYDLYYGVIGVGAALFWVTGSAQALLGDAKAKDEEAAARNVKARVEGGADLTSAFSKAKKARDE